MKKLFTDNRAKTKEITLVGSILLIIIGIIFLGASSSDPSGIIFWIGIIFLIAGIVSFITILIKLFK